MKKSVILVISILLVSVISINLVNAQDNETNETEECSSVAISMWCPDCDLEKYGNECLCPMTTDEQGCSVWDCDSCEPISEAEKCAASISMNFNQDVYHSGDFFKVTTRIFDSQGNPLPNYPFYIGASSASRDGQEFDTDTGTTNEQGYLEQSDSALEIMETVKVLYKVYTQETSSCPSIEDIVEIEYIGEETSGEEPFPPTKKIVPKIDSEQPEKCAAKITITFDKDVYYIGDTAEIVVMVLDSQGNPLSNYVFNNQIYDGIWHTPGEQKTDGSGYLRGTPTIEKEQSKLGETKFKVYTNKYSNCNSVEDIAEFEIREKEGEPEPVPCGIGTCIPEEAEEVEKIPEDKIFYKCNGCKLEGKCYPMGYRKEGQYCSDNNKFVNQIDGKCDNSFECKSNVCISGECIEEGLIKKIIKWFKTMFGGEDEDEEPGLKMCSKLLIEKNIGDYEYFISEYGKREEHQIGLFSEDGEQIGIVKCCVAGYKNPDGTEGKAGIVCPLNNKKDVENALRGLSNMGEIVLGEYKGQKIYRRFDKPEETPEIIVWTNNVYLIASGVGPGEGPLSEEVADAYLKKYPNDLGEIEISGVEELPSNFESLPAKEEIENIHMRNLKYFIAGDAEGIASAYSSNYLDTGGGPEGTGEVQLDEAYFEDFFSSERFDELKGKPISELVDLDKKEVYSYEEIMNSKYENLGSRVGFRYMKGDIVIIFPPKEGSPLFDGWSGVYRKENGVWKIIAGD